MKEKAKITIRPMSFNEVEQIAIEWAAKEGWNPGLYDAQCFFKAAPNNFFIGSIHNIPVACISAVTYSNNFAFIGFYIVKEEERGKGYGLQLWNQTLQKYSSYNMGLDGVFSQEENYKKSGFKYAYNNIRFQGKAQKNSDSFVEIVPISSLKFMDILAYEANLFPANRADFLSTWLNQPKSLALAAIFHNKICGYGLIRTCRQGYKIGPLFAESLELALKIYYSLIDYATAGEDIFLDIPEANAQALKLTENLKMIKVFETKRMYSQFQPNIALNKIFGVTSFELG